MLRNGAKLTGGIGVVVTLWYFLANHMHPERPISAYELVAVGFVTGVVLLAGSRLIGRRSKGARDAE